MEKHLLGNLLVSALEEEPEMRLEASRDSIKVFLWFDSEIGRLVVVGIAGTFEEAFAQACEKRKERIANAVIEAEVRAEVKRRVDAEGQTA